MVQREGEGALFAWGEMPEMMGVMAVAVLGGGDVEDTSLPPRTWMISCWWRMGCQVPSGDWYSAVRRCRGCARCRCPGRRRRGW